MALVTATLELGWSGVSTKAAPDRSTVTLLELRWTDWSDREAVVVHLECLSRTHQ